MPGTRSGAAGAFRSLSAILACLLLGAATPPVRQSAPELSVRPGGVARWSGAGIERCGMDGSEWPPLAGACWFAVDLLAEEGAVPVSRWRGGQRERALLRVGAYPYDVQRIELKDDRTVHLSKQDQARVERENAKIAELWWRRGAPRFTLPLAAPLSKLPAGGRFGSRRIFNGEPRSPHSGADYAATHGTPVLAAADGTVALADDLFFSGNSVFIDHGDGLISMYFHLSELGVAPGATVKRGQTIGKVGATGRATGPHLHFGLRWRGARIDPALLLASPDRLPEIR